MPGESRNWTLGVHLKRLDVYFGTRNADGSVTWNSTAVTLKNRVDYFRCSDMRMLDMIVNLGASYAHYEKTLMDSSFMVGEILRNLDSSGAASGAYLPQLAQGYDLAKVVASRGKGTTGSNLWQRYTFRGTIRSFDDGVTAFGKNACEMILAPFVEIDTAGTGLEISPLLFDTE